MTKRSVDAREVIRRWSSLFLRFEAVIVPERGRILYMYDLSSNAVIQLKNNGKIKNLTEKTIRHLKSTRDRVMTNTDLNLTEKISYGLNKIQRVLGH